MPLKLQPMIGWCTLLNMYIYQSVCWKVLCSFLDFIHFNTWRQLSAFMSGHTLWSSDFYCQALSSFILGVFPLLLYLVLTVWFGSGFSTWLLIQHHTYVVCVCVWWCGLVHKAWAVALTDDLEKWKSYTIHSQAPFCMKTIFWSCMLLFFLPGFFLLICWADSSRLKLHIIFEPQTVRKCTHCPGRTCAVWWRSLFKSSMLNVLHIRTMFVDSGLMVLTLDTLLLLFSLVCH